MKSRRKMIVILKAKIIEEDKLFAKYPEIAKIESKPPKLHDYRKELARLEGGGNVTVFSQYGGTGDFPIESMSSAPAVVTPAPNYGVNLELNYIGQAIDRAGRFK